MNNIKNEIVNFDIIINATSLGLKDGHDFDFNLTILKGQLILIQYTIHWKQNSKILGKDVKVFNGLDMFIYQGQKAFYLWNKLIQRLMKINRILLSNL